jgi:polyisoprenyl-teichoic acid--peptidoglycan teichoic acid transferase
MTQPRPSMDGFVPRRPGATSRRLSEQPQQSATRFSRPQPIKAAFTTDSSGRVPASLSRSDLDESLKSIGPDKDGKKRGLKRGGGSKKSRLRRAVKWLIILLLVGGLGVGGYLAYKALNAGSQVFQGNIFEAIVQNQPLKQDVNGRSNILVLGTSEDDPGHDAPYLTDSIMILSVDQTNKNAYMFSLPRDFEVQYGELCEAGSRGKINNYYHWCADGANGNVEGDRAALTKTAGFIGNIVGLDIQYGVNVNYTVMRDLVSAVGGITVTIESRNPQGQMDSNFDWKCGVVGVRMYRSAKEKQVCPPNGHYIDYPNGPVQLDAEHALYLAQARGDTAPTYGFEQSNFDREKNQQKIVKAIREKATSAGVLTDFGKVSGIIDALGHNLRTTFGAAEVRTLIDLAQNIKSESIHSISLIDGDEAVFSGNAQLKAGMYQYGPLQALIKKKLNADPAASEGAKIVVLNGSGVAGVAQREADALAAKGFVISSVATAPEASYADVEIYQIGEGMAATRDRLKSLYNAEVKTTPPPAGAAAGTNFVIIFGKDRQSPSAQ